MLVALPVTVGVAIAVAPYWLTWEFCQSTKVNYTTISLGKITIVAKSDAATETSAVSQNG